MSSGTSRGEPRHHVGNGAPGAWKKSALRSARVSQNGSRKRSSALTTPPVRTHERASRLPRSGGSNPTPSLAARTLTGSVTSSLRASISSAAPLTVRA